MNSVKNVNLPLELRGFLSSSRNVKARSGVEARTFSDTRIEAVYQQLDVFGDGSVVILEMPGHTPGHTVLQVNLFESGLFLLTGDLYHRAESRKLQRVPRFNTNESQTRGSMIAFERLATELGARVIIQHEAIDVSRLPKPPRFLK